MDLREKWNDYRINRLIACAWFVIITILTLSPHVHTPTIVTWQDKLEHMVAFGILSLFICRSFNPATRYSPMDRVLTAMVIVTLYGALDEIMQGFVPSRDASIGDLAADLSGAFLGGISFLYIPFLNNIRKE